MPTPPALVSPQNPVTCCGADPTGVADSSPAFQKAAGAGDLSVPAGTFLLNTILIKLGSRHMQCAPDTVLKMTRLSEGGMFRVTGNGSVFNCHFQGPNYNMTVPNFNKFTEDFLWLIPPSYGYMVVGNDFNGQPGYTGAVDVYASAADYAAGRINVAPIIGWNTFEHCGYYAVQITSARNANFEYNTALDCAGFVEADNMGQINTGNVGQYNHFTFTNGDGWYNHGNSVNANYYGCGDTASGMPYDYSGNLCHDDIIDGAKPSILQILASCVSGSCPPSYSATYYNETCTGGCVQKGTQAFQLHPRSLQYRR